MTDPAFYFIIKICAVRTEIAVDYNVNVAVCTPTSQEVANTSRSSEKAMLPPSPIAKPLGSIRKRLKLQ